MQNILCKNISSQIFRPFIQSSNRPFFISLIHSYFRAAIIFLAMMFYLLIAPSSVYSQTSRDLSSGMIYLSEYIASPGFAEIKENRNNLALIDSIWMESYRYFHGDISEALLAATFATLPFDKMPLKLPFGLKMDLLLPSPGDSLFQKKIKNLPSGFLIDSPKGKNSDTDKIAHFFGNAFLSYNISWIHLSDFLGLFVETFEKSFKVNGSLDLRDLTINRFGSAFGKALNNNRTLSPSLFFEGYNAFYLFMKNPTAITQ